MARPAARRPHPRRGLVPRPRRTRSCSRPGQNLDPPPARSRPRSATSSATAAGGPSPGASPPPGRPGRTGRVYYLRTVDDAERMRAPSHGDGSMVVIGGGFIGDRGGGQRHQMDTRVTLRSGPTPSGPGPSGPRWAASSRPSSATGACTSSPAPGPSGSRAATRSARPCPHRQPSPRRRGRHRGRRPRRHRPGPGRPGCRHGSGRRAAAGGRGRLGGRGRANAEPPVSGGSASSTGPRPSNRGCCRPSTWPGRATATTGAVFFSDQFDLSLSTSATSGMGRRGGSGQPGGRRPQLSPGTCADGTPRAALIVNDGNSGGPVCARSSAGRPVTP